PDGRGTGHARPGPESPTNRRPLHSGSGCLLTSSSRLLDPLERTCEILFGVIVVLTFTGSISVAEGGRGETRTVLLAAIGCNLAWGIVDGAMYLMSNFAERRRAYAALGAIRASGHRDEAHRLIVQALPEPVAAILTSAEVETLRQRLQALPEPLPATLKKADFAGAFGVFLLVFLSTLPVVAPFVFLAPLGLAMRTSNAIAVAMLFITGWKLGQYSGVAGWRTGLGMVALGVVLVATTMALGG